jgi:hypothetical protein
LPRILITNSSVPSTRKPCNNYEKRKKTSAHQVQPIPSNNLLTNQRPRPKRSGTAVSLPLLATLLERLDVLDLGSFGCFDQKSAMPFFNFQKHIVLTFFAIQPILTALGIFGGVAAHGRAG